MNEVAQRFRAIIDEVREEYPGCAVVIDPQGFPKPDFLNPSQPPYELDRLATEMAVRQGAARGTMANIATRQVVVN